MATIELFIYLIMLISILIALFFLKSVRKGWLVLLIFSAMALFFHLDHLLQLVTSDEPYMLQESAFMSTSPLYSMQYYGVLKTSNLIIGSLMNGIRAATAFPNDSYFKIAKMLHWLIGIIILTAIAFFVYFRFSPSLSPVLFAGSYIILVLLLPVTILACKVFTYDLLSMLLGVFALLLMERGIAKNSTRLMLLAIVVSVLAAQEKMIASPIMFLCIILYPAVAVFRMPSLNYWSVLKTLSLRCFASVLLAMSVLGISTLFIIIQHTTPFPLKIIELKMILWPFIGATIPFIFAIGNNSFLRSELVHIVKSNIPAVIMLILTCGALFLAGIAVIITRFKKTLSHMSKKTESYRAILLPLLIRMVYGALFIALIAGMICTYTIHAKQAPFCAYQPGDYQPTSSFNGGTAFYGAPNFPLHLLYGIGYSYAVFTNAFPTVLLIIIIICFFMDKRQQFSMRDSGWSLFYMLAMLFCSSTPLLFGLTQTPVLNRYFNLFIFLIALAFSSRFAQILSSIKFKSAVLILFLFLCLHIAENYPFCPLFGGFRPIWSNASHNYNSTPSIGILNPSWTSWGEEICLAGKKILATRNRNNSPADNITLYVNFWGGWLGAPENVKIVSMIQNDKPLSYTSNDYYILSREGLSRWYSGFPWNLSPLFTLDYRGMVYAWVFRGDQIDPGKSPFWN